MKNWEIIGWKINDIIWDFCWIILKDQFFFQDLLSYNEVQYLSFKEVVQKQGLLESDDFTSKCLCESTSFEILLAMCLIFATILVYC